MQKELYEAAVSYVKKGFSVIPLYQKHPPKGFNWKEYQERIATNEELITWFSREDITGVGIVLGKISGLIALDVEATGDISGRPIPVTPTSKTGGGGHHYIFKYPTGGNNIHTINLRTLGIEGEFRGDGSIIVAPPSQHPNGKKYEWQVELDEEIADIPPWLVELLKSESIQIKKDWPKMFQGVKEGNRHTTLMILAGKLIHHMPEKHWGDIVWPTLQLWNEKNNPPLPIAEIKSAFSYCADKKLSEINRIDKGKGLLSMGDILNSTDETSPFLIEKLVPSLGITALTGHPSGGKSWIMLAMAKAVAMGEKLFGVFETTKGAVLIIDEENGVQEFKRRLKFLDMPEDLEIYFYCQNGLKIDEPKDLQNIISVIREKDIKLVVIDPLVAIHSKNENTSNEMQSVMGMFEELNRAGATVLYVHHHRKDGLGKSNASQSIRGSSAFSGRADSHISVEKKEESEAGIEIAVTQDKLRRGKKIEPFTIMLVEEAGRITLNYTDGVKTELYKKENAKNIILNLLGEGPKLTDEIIHILSEEDIGARNIQDALREMVKSEVISKRKEGRKDQYFLVEKEEETLTPPEHDY